MLLFRMKIGQKNYCRNTTFTTPSIDWLSPELLRGIRVKAEIVEQDEFEQSTRKFLKFRAYVWPCG